MKRKIITLVVSWLIINIILCINPVFAEDEFDYLPVKVCDAIVTRNIIGSPELTLGLVNSTDKIIDAFEFECKVYDTYGRPVSSWGSRSNVFKGIAQGKSLDHAATFTWSLAAYDLATNVQEVVIKSVHFTDGTTWTYDPKKWYKTEAEFMISEKIGDSIFDVTDDQALSLKTPLTVSVVDTSYSAKSWDWYIWDDNSGWVWFANGIMANCDLWSQGASIKLIINGNPDLYAIHNVNVKYITHFTMKNINKAFSWQDDVIKSDSSLVINNLPYTFQVADNTEFVDSRAWYVWEDDKGWVWFSDEQTAQCTLWKEGAAIKLVVNGDENNYEIQNINLRLKENY